MRVLIVVIVIINCLASNMAIASDIDEKLDKALLAIELLISENEKLLQRIVKLENIQTPAVEPDQLISQKLTIKIPKVATNIEERVSYLESSTLSKRDSLMDRISINGYSSFEFEEQLGDDGFGDTNASFDADLFDLVINVQVNDKLRASADITWEHGSASEENRGNVALEYGFAEYAFSNSLKLRVGKMFTPFGIFNEIHTAKPAYLSVKEAGSTNKPKNVVDGSPRFYPRWGAGIALQGDMSIKGKHLDYNFMVSNGDQKSGNPFEKDDNNNKAITFRSRYDVSEDLQIGFSVYYDKGVSKEVLSQGLQFEYFTGNWGLLGEGVWGEISPSIGQDISHYGWFIQPSYSFENGLTPYFRFEHYDPDSDISDNQGYEAIFGINHLFNGMTFKLEHIHNFGGSNSIFNTFPGNSYNEIQAAIVVGF